MGGRAEKDGNKVCAQQLTCRIPKLVYSWDEGSDKRGKEQR